ncbi:MAG: Na+:solute symporter [Chitinophagaceae bacterium]|jgi:SSS family transporter|nr:Na+:solute symporter [Chitinophagaceae bacterium]
MSLLDLIVIAVFSVIVVVTGLSFTRSAKSMQSFFAAGGAIPWYINGLSLFMGFFSAGTFVVWGSIAYTNGFVAISIQWTMALAGFAVGLFIAPIWRKNRALTAAGYIQKRLGVSIQKAYSGLFLFISLFSTGAFLYPVARIVQVATGYPIEICIGALGLISILYVAAGGLWAVVVTDVLQFVILFAVVIVVAILSFSQAGGFAGISRVVPNEFFYLLSNEFSFTFIAGFALYNLFFLGGNWAYVQRYTSAANTGDARKTAWLFGILYLVSPLVWMLPPMLYRVFDATLSPVEAEGAYLLMCKQVLPSGMLGLMIGGMVFATASSLNSILNVSAGVITQDLYPLLFGQSSEKHLLRVARISTVVLGLFAIGIALMVKHLGGIVNVVITVAALTGVPLYLPVIWSLFSKRQTGITVLLTTILSLIANLLMKFAGPMVGFQLSRGNEMLAGALVPCFLVMLSELLLLLKQDNKVLYNDTVQSELLEDNRAINGADVQSDNKYGRRVIGISITVSALIITGLGLTASHGIGIITSVGAFISAIGIFIWLKNKS